MKDNVALPPSAIALSDIDFSWGGRSGFGLRLDTLEIARGEKVFLFGESGSGKSTLLSLICGVNLPQSGSVLADGTELTSLSSGARDRFRAERIGVIFQMFNLLPYATPLDNILLPLAFAPERRARLNGSQRSQALELTDQLGLPQDAILNATAAELSVGQQQRVAVARALIGQPPIIIADEPTSSLDATSQNAFVDMLFEQVESAGSTLLMVSHDLRLADKFDRVVDLKEIAKTRRGGVR